MDTTSSLSTSSYGRRRLVKKTTSYTQMRRKKISSPKSEKYAITADYNANQSEDASAPKLKDQTKKKQTSKAKPKKSHGGSGDGGGFIPPIRNYTVDLSTLTKSEEDSLRDLLEKDACLNKCIDQRIEKIRSEMQEIRQKGMLTPGEKQNKLCARCKYRFWSSLVPFGDHGKNCTNCHFKVCKKCRTLQDNNSTFICILCLKQRQERNITGMWIYQGQPPGLHGSDLLRASMRDYFKRVLTGRGGGGGGGGADDKDGGGSEAGSGKGKGKKKSGASQGGKADGKDKKKRKGSVGSHGSAGSHGSKGSDKKKKKGKGDAGKGGDSKEKRKKSGDASKGNAKKGDDKKPKKK